MTSLSLEEQSLQTRLPENSAYVGRAAEDTARGIFADNDLISVRKKLHRVRVGLKREPAPEILWQHDASGLVDLSDDTQ